MKSFSEWMSERDARRRKRKKMRSDNVNYAKYITPEIAKEIRAIVDSIGWKGVKEQRPDLWELISSTSPTGTANFLLKNPKTQMFYNLN